MTRPGWEGWELFSFHLNEKELTEPAVRQLLQKTVVVEARFDYEYRAILYLAWIPCRPLDYPEGVRAPRLDLRLEELPVIGNMALCRAALVLGCDPIVEATV